MNDWSDVTDIAWALAHGKKPAQMPNKFKFDVDQQQQWELFTAMEEDEATRPDAVAGKACLIFNLTTGLNSSVDDIKNMLIEIGFIGMVDSMEAMNVKLYASDGELLKLPEIKEE